MASFLELSVDQGSNFSVNLDLTNDEILTEINTIQNECGVIGHYIMNITASENTIIANNKTNLSYCINCGEALD